MRWVCNGVAGMILVISGQSASAGGEPENLLANPGFEQVLAGGFFADWGAASQAKVGKTLFVDREHSHAGQFCIRLRGTPHTWTNCAAKAIPVQPEIDYWITWWLKTEQPDISRTYLYLQTNLAQRVFPQTDRTAVATGR